MHTTFKDVIDSRHLMFGRFCFKFSTFATNKRAMFGHNNFLFGMGHSKQRFDHSVGDEK